VAERSCTASTATASCRGLPEGERGAKREKGRSTDEESLKEEETHRWSKSGK